MLEKERDIAEAASRAAGKAIREIVEDGFKTTYKKKDDPLTTADLAANRILKEHLTAVFPEDGWLSEETADSAERLSKARVWIVDPIDGTRELVNGIPEYAISVALVEAGQVILGVVYNPVKEECFTAVRGEGMWHRDEPVSAAHRLDGKPVLLCSRSETQRGEFKPFEGHAELRVVGSIAYKLALLAAGEGDGIYSRVNKNEWDVAAGVLMVEQAGGKVTDLDGNPLSFNQRKTLLDNGLVATTAEAYDPIVRLAEKVLAEEEG